ncbi:chromatin binding protein [Coniosporium tulheliwenetii]|uniref:Chromatin binding protein n=1 Tax=Coniosporium tulheliwenetii TaxID=3383036 RepID=A0ACC2ZKV7_9PEZI|nr:chromatin binding protein [Cladosporium sp. JES 115]
MNLSLVDPFILAQDCPETLTGKLRSGSSSQIRFSYRGDLLASGRTDGIVSIFDTETCGVARKLRGHTAAIAAISWSKDGRYLLSAGSDCKCVLWDLQDGSRLRTVRFEAPIYTAELHPSNHLLFAVSLLSAPALLVDASADIPKKHALPLKLLQPGRREEDGSKKGAKPHTTAAAFISSGDYLLTATSQGRLNIISTASREAVQSFQLSNAPITTMRLTNSGRAVAVNSADRVVRTLHLPDFSDEKLDIGNLRLEVEHKFQDVVNRLRWNYVSLSPTGEYVTASTGDNHDIYVWERGQGSLVKILEHSKEELYTVEWHPNKPLIAAAGSESGRIYLWSIVAPQRWSALAPDFVEVEENVEYIEKEDEFDIQPLETLHKRRLDAEDEDVDVLTVEPPKAGGSEWEGAFRMPVLLDIEDSDSEDEIEAVGAGQYRRKSPGRNKEWMDGGSGDEKRVNGTAKANGTKRRRGD